MALVQMVLWFCGFVIFSPSPSWALARAAAEHVASDERTDVILSHVQALCTQTKDIKAEISRRRKNLVRRRSKLDFAIQRESNG